jgi:galacturan 1,4-alpha-galacturonidase
MMRFHNDKVEDLNIAYIGGGSRNWAWSLMSDLALEGQLSGVVRLYDIDYEAACENRDFGNKISLKAEAVGKWKYEVAECIEEALTGADFVVISILPGTFEEMRSDVHLPEKYGIYQSVGDTVGPAGLVRALRTIPMYVEFAEKIRQYAPNAWVINYTNPMTLCTRTLYAVFPGIKAFGCCHGVFEGQEVLVQALKEMRGIDAGGRNEIKTNVLGINHFTWIDQASYKNLDLFPVFSEFAEKYAEEGYQEKGKDSWEKNVGGSANRVTFDLFRRYGIMAFSADRHLAEFVPPWYLKDLETVRSWKFNLTPVDFRIESSRKQNERRKRILAGDEEFILRHTGEEGVHQIKSLLGLDDFVTNVNIPNKGQFEGIPLGSVVETNAYFSRDSVRPVFAGKLPEDVQNLVVRHVYNQETILKAALAKDKELAFRAFLNDPLVTLSIRDARELFEQMLKNTRQYLPGWDI